MKLFITKNKKLGDKKAFEIIKNQLLKNPSSLLGLAAGKTTDDLYKLISRDSVKHPNIWEKLKIFQIDENIGIKPDSPLSFNHEIRRELKPLIKILNKKNIFLMDGTKNPKKTISKGYRFVKKNKWIDLIILGIGPEYDPHIAYNTTRKSNLNSRMRVVDLHPKTIHVIARKHKVLTKQSQNRITVNYMPQQGITLGIKDILECKKILLIAYGKDKAKSLKLALKGKVNIKKVPASALQLHKDLKVVIDKEAARLIDN